MSTAEQYYEEFIRYYWLADEQQRLCNLGTQPYAGSVDDDLMQKVELYDVVERKYAGFSQIVNDCFYGWTTDHPYWEKMRIGNVSPERHRIAPTWTGKRDKWRLEDWLYLFLVHRVTGSGINYAKKPSGYHNTILPEFCDCDGIEDMIERIKVVDRPIYTSIGSQFPTFPKPVPPYRRGGDYFMCEMMPELARLIAHYLQMLRNNKPAIRTVGELMHEWNKSKGLKRYNFQYAAFLADVCDWFPDLIDRSSHFYYGKNGIECLSYLTGGKKSVEDLDGIMTRIMDDTGALPYNAEDVCCDWIRWVENYVRPGAAYDHLDRDKVWSSHRIADHPYGRQRPMLDLSLISSFNDLKNHPSDDYILREAGWTVERYQSEVNKMRTSS